MEAEDLDVAHILTSDSTVDQDEFEGQVNANSGSGRFIYVSQEFRHDHLGHMCVLDLKKLVPPVKPMRRSTIRCISPPATGRTTTADMSPGRTFRVGPVSRAPSMSSWRSSMASNFCLCFDQSRLFLKPDTSILGALPLHGVTLHNYAEINSRVDLVQSLLNSGIFTGGVLLGTVLFGVLAGYALARLHFRGRGTLFAVMLLVQIIPFQLLIIPIYVMIVRTYGLADTYVGMIVPFLINSTAVFVFRQFFLALPDDLFSAAALDGASELRILWSVALPLVRPALLTVVLITFIGPWNEFLWPFLVTKDQSLQPLAVTLANYISNIAGRADEPVRRDPRGRGRARRAGRGAVRRLPEAVHGRRAQQRGEGMTSASKPVHDLLGRRPGAGRDALALARRRRPPLRRGRRPG